MSNGVEIGERATRALECEERLCCTNCHQPECDHVEGKCLYAPGYYTPGMLLYDADGRVIDPHRFSAMMGDMERIHDRSWNEG